MKEWMALIDSRKDAITIKKNNDRSIYPSLQIKWHAALKTGELQAVFCEKIYCLYKNFMPQIDTLNSSYSQNLHNPEKKSRFRKKSTSDQLCFNVVDQRWNNVDPTMKMKQNSTPDFQRCTTLIQRQFPTLKQRWNNVGRTLVQRCFNLASTLVKTILNPVGLVVMIMNLQIQEWFLFF